MRVVVVDDSGIFREGLVALLTVAGVEVVEALASTEGLGAAILLERPDAVILDVRLPPATLMSRPGRGSSPTLVLNLVQNFSSGVQDYASNCAPNSR